MRLSVSLACLLLLASPAAAQVSNPTAVTFDHADHAATDSYTLGYFTDATVTTPVQTGTLPKPATCAPCAGPLVSRPTAFQAWWVAVRAHAGTAVSGWSNRVPFLRVLVAPTNLQVN